MRTSFAFGCVLPEFGARSRLAELETRPGELSGLNRRERCLREVRFLADIGHTKLDAWRPYLARAGLSRRAQ